MIIVTAAEMRAADEATVSLHGVESYQLMERAGQAVAARIPAGPGSVFFFCGGGNNGGDGFIAAREARLAGREVRVFAIKPLEQLVGDAKRAAQSFVDSGGVVEKLDLPSIEALAEQQPATIVDALFGTGFTPPARDLAARAIDLISSLRDKFGAFVLAVDLPSGLDADSASVVGPAVQADETISLQALKPALLLLPAAMRAGVVTVADIGVILPDAKLRWSLFTAQVASTLLAQSPLNGSESHKGSRGHVAVIGGGPGHFGAPRISAEAALRSGAGLVTLALPSQAAQTTSSLNELMCVGLPEAADGSFSGEGDLEQLFRRKQAVVLGPGLGGSQGAKRLVARVFETINSTGLVLDADALNLISADPELRRSVPPGAVLTPHPAEMGRLLNRTTAEVQADRFEAATRLAIELAATVVLKGARTVVADSSGAVSVNPTAEAALGTAGSGDLLAGIIGALLAQGYRSPEAAKLGVFLHGAAAELAVREQGSPWGIVASDFGRAIGHAVRQIRQVAATYPSEFGAPLLPHALAAETL